jgi:hypothetical protein
MLKDFPSGYIVRGSGARDLARRGSELREFT